MFVDGGFVDEGEHDRREKMTREARFWIKCEQREAGRPHSPVGTMYLVLCRID